VDSPLNVWVRRIAVLLVVAVAAVLLVPLSARIFGPVLGIAAWAGAAFGYVCIVVGIPFLLWIIGRPGYRTFIRPYVRARRIRLITQRRLLREAASRSNSAQQ
jgi:hypothetical protein